MADRVEFMTAVRLLPSVVPRLSEVVGYPFDICSLRTPALLFLDYLTIVLAGRVVHTLWIEITEEGNAMEMCSWMVMGDKLFLSFRQVIPPVHGLNK